MIVMKFGGTSVADPDRIRAVAEHIVCVECFKVIEFTDPTIAGQDFELIAQDAVLLQSNPLRVRRVVVRLGDATVAFHSTNLRVRTLDVTQLAAEMRDREKKAKEALALVVAVQVALHA